jgi:hypothetical protein
VMGNADAWLLTGTGLGKMSPERRIIIEDVREWSSSKLDARDRGFVAAFLPTVTIPIEAGRTLFAYHGSPASFDDIILPTTPEDEFVRLLGPYRPNLLTGGHVHMQFVRHLGDTFHFNPGSMGMAYRQGQKPEELRLDPWAEYAVLGIERGRWALEFRRVPFSVDELVRVYRESGCPHADDALRQYGRA